METEKLIQKSDVSFGNLKHVKLTKEVITQLNLYQAGGTIGCQCIENIFNNDIVNEGINRLSQLYDFIFQLYKKDYYDDAKVIMDHLCYISELKWHFNQLKPFPDGNN